jgi:hypothetical protein
MTGLEVQQGIVVFAESNYSSFSLAKQRRAEYPAPTKNGKPPDPQYNSAPCENARFYEPFSKRSPNPGLP